MARVQVADVFPSSVHDAETCWYDTARWPDWIDELVRVVSVDGDWPRAGSSVVWESGPAGRGRVRERVIEYEPLVGQTLEVEDNSIRGRQSVSFTTVEGGVEVALGLSYTIKRRSPLTPIIDRLFVRRPMTASLRKTLSGFGLELAKSGRSSVE